MTPAPAPATPRTETGRPAPDTTITPAPESLARPAPAPDPELPAPLPTPAPAPAPSLQPPRLRAPVRLAFTGDINLGTSTLAGGVPPDSGRSLFEHARASLTGDLVIGNLEGVLADSGTSSKCPPPEPPHRPGSRPGTGPGAKATGARRTPRDRRPPPPVPPKVGCYAFLTPTYLARRLVDAGFTHLNLANNHANDYGPDGRLSTEATVQRLGLDVYGPLGRVAFDSIRRGDSLTTVALVGFATYPHSYNLLDIARSVTVVDSVRRLADLVVVTFHGGAEGLAATHVPEAAESLGAEPRGELRRWARAVIDAGADLVVGHGPHVLRGMEFYQGKLIAYSLGNFLTYRGFNLNGALGITGVLQVEFGPNRVLRRTRLVPMRQIPGQGVVADPDGTALQLVRQLSTEDFGMFGARVAADGIITAP